MLPRQFKSSDWNGEGGGFGGGGELSCRRAWNGFFSQYLILYTFENIMGERVNSVWLLLYDF